MNFLIPLLMSLTLTLHVQTRSRGVDYKENIIISGCTAVWVSPTEALTAAHCVEHSTGRMWVLDSDNRSFSASVERIDKRLDLCLLKIKAPKHLYAKMGYFVNRGDKVFIMNSGNFMNNMYGEGIVANILDDPDEMTLSVIHTATILPGASGSGLFNARGELVGINTATYHALTSAVDLTEIEYFLTGKRRA